MTSNQWIEQEKARKQAFERASEQQHEAMARDSLAAAQQSAKAAKLAALAAAVGAIGQLVVAIVK